VFLTVSIMMVFVTDDMILSPSRPAPAQAIPGGLHRAIRCCGTILVRSETIAI